MRREVLPADETALQVLHEAKNSSAKFYVDDLPEDVWSACYASN